MSAHGKTRIITAVYQEVFGSWYVTDDLDPAQIRKESFMLAIRRMYHQLIQREKELISFCIIMPDRFHVKTDKQIGTCCIRFHILLYVSKKAGLAT